MKESSDNHPILCDNHPIFHDNHLDKNVGKLPQHIEYLASQEMKEDVKLALYALAVREKYGKLPLQAGHFYVHPDLVELKMVDVDEKAVGAVVKRIKEAVEGILAEDFEIYEQPGCYYCDYGAVCEWRN